jgi:hypothetical protein
MPPACRCGARCARRRCRARAGAPPPQRPAPGAHWPSGAPPWRRGAGGGPPSLRAATPGGLPPASSRPGPCKRAHSGYRCGWRRPCGRPGANRPGLAGGGTRWGMARRRACAARFGCVSCVGRRTMAGTRAGTRRLKARGGAGVAPPDRAPRRWQGEGRRGEAPCRVNAAPPPPPRPGPGGARAEEGALGAPPAGPGAGPCGVRQLPRRPRQLPAAHRAPCGMRSQGQPWPAPRWPMGRPRPAPCAVQQIPAGAGASGRAGMAPPRPPHAGGVATILHAINPRAARRGGSGAHRRPAQKKTGAVP